MATTFDRALQGALPLYRNALSDAHGSIKADTSWYERGTPALLECARTFIDEADALGGGRLVYAEEVRVPRPGDREVVMMDLTGPAAIRRHVPEAYPAAPAGRDEEVLPGRLYLEIAPGRPLCLHPLLYYHAGELVDQVFFLNRARGVDRRIFVWGDYPVWSFCNSTKGGWGRGVLKRCGSHPADESVFGIRDLAGSVCEPTSEKTTGRYRYIAQRGGNWYTTEDQYFRAANRNGILPDSQSIEMGIRLVAELPAGR